MAFFPFSDMESIESIRDIIFLVSNVMEGYSVALFVADRKRENRLRLFCYDSFSKNIDVHCRLDKGEGLISWVHREQKPLVINNFDNDTSTLKFYKKNENIKAFMAVPLPDRKGVLCVDSKKSYIFTEEKEKIFKQIAIVVYKSLIRIGLEKDKINLKKMIECSLKIDDAIFITTDINNKIYKIFQLIYFYFDTNIIILYLYGKYNFILSLVDNIFNINNDSSNLYGNNIISICIKNKKTICRNNIKTKVILKVDPQKNVFLNNYLCIPLISLEKKDIGCILFSKKENLTWKKAEAQFLERVARKIYLILSSGNGGRL